VDANDTNRKSKLIYPELSYKITGISSKFIINWEGIAEKYSIVIC